MTEQQKWSYEFGKRLRNKLKEQGRTQLWLAVEVDTTEQSICRYVNGQRVPNAVMFHKIAQALGVSMNWLWCGGD